MDWWPTSLYVHTQKPPYNNPEFRWALSYLIDRDQLIKVGWNGASEKTELPMPNFPGLKPFFDAAKPLLAKYPTNEFNPEKGHAHDVEARLEEGQRRHVRASRTARRSRWTSSRTPTSRRSGRCWSSC